MKKILFSSPLITGKEIESVRALTQNPLYFEDAHYGRMCTGWMKTYTSSPGVCMVPSGTSALEMAALLSGVVPGDEVIMPSFTFVSTANAFVLRGAVPVFTDIRRDTLNIDENLVADAITPRTRAIVAMHYGGVSCRMEILKEIATEAGLFLIEDAATALMSSYMGKPLGTFGDTGCFSFNDKKNIHCGEGGAVCVNRDDWACRLPVLRDKGTNRQEFFEGSVPFYEWKEPSSNYFMNELAAAFLYNQLVLSEEETSCRMRFWSMYNELLSPLAKEEFIELPAIPEACSHNAHVFHIRLKNENERRKMMRYLGERGVETAFHYVPLHLSAAGRKYGRFHGDDSNTLSESSRLLRLPMHHNLSGDDVHYICKHIQSFFQ